MAKQTKQIQTKQVQQKPASKRSNPMTPKAGYTATRRRYGEGGKSK